MASSIYKQDLSTQYNPKLGPRLLFFSGGSALQGLCAELKHVTHNSIHLLNPFDSGGSSAHLRTAFDMPAVGDLRNRLMGLADLDQTGVSETYQLLHYRLSCTDEASVLLEELRRIIHARHPLTQGIPQISLNEICSALHYFAQRMPESFRLQGASIGNLVMAGTYLENGRNLTASVTSLAKLLCIQGVVEPVTEAPLHLAVELSSGLRMIGQHLVTGKEFRPLDARIESIWLSECPDRNCPVRPEISEQIAMEISQADLICYPPGSFYSSVIANLLPKGISKAVSGNSAAKVYVPNLGCDPEQFGMNLEQQIATLLSVLDALEEPEQKVLSHLLIDREQASELPNQDFLDRHGIQVIERHLRSSNTPYYDNQKLLKALLELI